jgi:hypothetical protein
MIPAIITRFDAKRQDLLAQFKAKRPDSYLDIVKAVVSAVTSEDDYGECNLDPDRITVIDHGDYQGSQLFIIAAKGYQPSDYWATEQSYGSCSGCDTLQAIGGYSCDPVTDDQAKDYWTLALHLAQRMERLFEVAANAKVDPAGVPSASQS